MSTVSGEPYDLKGSRTVRGAADGKGRATGPRQRPTLSFVQAIVEDRPCSPSFYDGMRCQAVIDAVLQSAAERRWIDVADVPPVTAPLACSARRE